MEMTNKSVEFWRAIVDFSITGGFFWFSELLWWRLSAFLYSANKLWFFDITQHPLITNNVASLFALEVVRG
jgi:hypothetical protein